MTIILGKRPTGDIVIDQLVMAIDPSNSMCYRPGVSSTLVRDISGKGANATTTGTYVTTAGGGIDFSGTNAITATSTAALRIGSTFSMGMWVYMNNFNPANQIVYRLIPTSGPTNAHVAINTEFGAFQAEIFNSNASAVVRTNGTATALVFQYWMITWDGSTVIIYRNGTSQTSAGSGLVPSIANTTSYYVFGNAVAQANPSGIIYAGHIYNKALSATEVTQNYNATKARFGL